MQPALQDIAGNPSYKNSFESGQKLNDAMQGSSIIRFRVKRRESIILSCINYIKGARITTRRFPKKSLQSMILPQRLGILIRI